MAIGWTYTTCSKTNLPQHSEVLGKCESNKYVLPKYRQIDQLIRNYLFSAGNSRIFLSK